MEESAELQQQSSKILRFGPNSKFNGETSLEEFHKEFGDLLCVIDLLNKSGLKLNFDRIHFYAEQKREKLKQWMTNKEK